MKRPKLFGSSVLLLCIVIGTFIFHHVYNKPAEVKQFEERLQETQLIDGIGKRLYEKGYSFSLNWSVLSKKKVDLVIKLPQTEVSEKTGNEVKQIINVFLMKSNVDPRIFKINVTNSPKLDNICEPN